MKFQIRSVICCLFFVAGGCEAKKCTIHGKVLLEGSPLVWNTDGGHLLVIYFPENRETNKEVYAADTDRGAGTYRIACIPAGKYRVAIQQFDEAHNDSLKKAYDPYATTLTTEVKEDGQAIDFDLPKPGGNRAKE